MDRKRVIAAGMSLLAAAVVIWRLWPDALLSLGARADAVLVRKGERVLMLMHDGIPLKRCAIALGRTPRGAKQREGDGRAPEGRYQIDGRNSRSGYHLSLRVSYPDAGDRRRGPYGVLRRGATS